MIYRSRSLIDATSLADHLRSLGFDARLAVENPQGYFGDLPTTDFVHEVMATNFDAKNLKDAVLEWERLRHDLKAAATQPYCYHCGMPVLKSAMTCVHCGEALVDGD